MWHYKCIRPILNDHRTWPQFLCPNCRAVADLEADVDDPYDYEEQLEDEANDSADLDGTGHLMPNTEHVFSIGTPDGTGPTQPADTTPVQRDPDPNGSEANLTTSTTNASLEADQLPTDQRDPLPNLFSRRNVSGTPMLQRGIKATKPTPDRKSPSPKVPSSPSISPEADKTQLTEPSTTLRVATPTGGEPSGPEGPMTPRNDAGPFVFDGSAGRASGRRVVASLAEAAAEDDEGSSAGT